MIFNDDDDDDDDDDGSGSNLKFESRSFHWKIIKNSFSNVWLSKMKYLWNFNYFSPKFMNFLPLINLFVIIKQTTQINNRSIVRV
jgi:hypothetical protein